jgi:hypothetical protein
MAKFNLTFETVTPESAEYGEADSLGFVDIGISLSDAANMIRNKGGFTFCEADSFPVTKPRWLTFYGIDSDMETGAVTSWSLHMPESLSNASRLRIARMFGCYGVQGKGRCANG